MRTIKFEDENKSHAAASVTHWLKFGYRSTSVNSNQIHYPGVESPWCVNGWQASQASLSPAGPIATPMPLKWEMTHQTLVTASWLPLACSEYSSWKLHWWANDLFNTCWYILHSNSLNASVRLTVEKIPPAEIWMCYPLWTLCGWSVLLSWTRQSCGFKAGRKCFCKCWARQQISSFLTAVMSWIKNHKQ